MQVMDAVQSLWHFCTSKMGEPPSLFLCSGGGCAGAKVTLPHRTKTGFNLPRVLRMDSWNVLSQSEDQRLPCILNELRRVMVNVIGLVLRREDLAVSRL